jgi:pheromone shutdown protein TraB
MTSANETQAEPVVELTIDDNIKVTLLGTAHISRASADKVKELLSTGQYDAVAVELCYSRHRAIIDPDALAKMDLVEVIREGKATMVAASLALGAFQQRMASKLNIKPGAEMRTAIEMAENLEIPLILIDREIGTTLKRVYRRVSWWQRMNLIAGLMVSVVSRHEVSEEEIERLKEGDILESTFTQFAEEAKELYTPLVDERDRFMAARVKQEAAKGKFTNLLAVVGAGHLKGIHRYLRDWNQLSSETLLVDDNGPRVQGKQSSSHKSARGSGVPQDKIGVTSVATGLTALVQPNTVINALNFIPASNRWPKVLPWLIVALILAGFVLGFYRSPELGWQLVVEWVVINGGLAAIGAIIALAHPFTIIGAFVAAPITSLNPTIGAGMVTAAIETMLRRPKVEDFSRLRADTTRVRGWWLNRVTRILLVFIFSTIGSAIGTYLAGFRIIEKLTT